MPYYVWGRDRMHIEVVRWCFNRPISTAAVRICTKIVGLCQGACDRKVVLHPAHGSGEAVCL